MRFIVFILAITVFGAWVSLSYFLLGGVSIPWLELTLPKSTSEFGDSVGILNGLFSALAVVLALVAVLLQGRELKESTKAQSEQANALKAQLKQQELINSEQFKRSQTIMGQLQQQQIATRVIILQAQQQYHSAEITRMDSILEKIEGNHAKNELFKGCLSKKKEHIERLKVIQEEFKKIQ